MKQSVDDFEERFNVAVKEAELLKAEWEALDHSECSFEGEGDEVVIHTCKHPLPLNNIPSRKIGSRLSKEMIARLEKIKQEITNERFVD